ncbi:M15 family metallopeptidase [Aquihabitans sp. McL0605]|uniref:M15 family metallopeptidase n=1 Tax=Aquihabitans sp. McL0605 TaxID=3415671 RepID=UPI003CF653E4
MAPRKPAQTRARRLRAAVATVIVAVAVVVIGAVGCRPPASSSPSRSSAPRPVALQVATPSPLAPAASGPITAGRAAVGVADGVVPDGVTVFRDDVPAVARLDPKLLTALRRAAEDAAGAGIEFEVNSGWRSTAYQEQLRRDAVAKYGSEEEASRWVAPPDRSAHVSGDAIDLGSKAAAWLSDHGARYGLCRIYDNERWHYELRPAAVDHGCPTRYADAAHDPRLQP